MFTRPTFQLITPAELIHPDIDERSVMTYLSQFPAAKPAPAKPTKAHAYMSRVDEKPLRGQPTEFEVHLTTDGYKPKVNEKFTLTNVIFAAMNCICS